MGRPRRYGSGAERQRAFRERQERETRRVDRRALEGLEGRLNALQEAVWAAASAGDEVAKRSQAVGVETMLEKLTRYFAGSARERKEGKEGG
jgi:hypothetical protein